MLRQGIGVPQTVALAIAILQSCRHSLIPSEKKLFHNKFSNNSFLSYAAFIFAKKYTSIKIKQRFYLKKKKKSKF